LALSPNLRGALFMAIAMAGFAINDTFTKSLTASINVGQIMLVRGLMASILMFLYCWQTGALRPPKMLLRQAVIGRSIGEMLGTVTFLIGLQHIHLGNASAILQALPLAVTMGAALFLNEKVGWRRWLAICIGFVGVLIVVRPGADGFSVWSLMIVACVIFCMARDLITRAAPPDIPSAFLALSTTCMITLTGLLLYIPLGGWQPLALIPLAKLAAAAVCLLIGYLFVIRAMRVGEIGFVAPFRYTGLLWSLTLAFFTLNEVPDFTTLIGAAVIIGSGVYAFHRERVHSRKTIEQGV
jgi:drug/metabolite transporter (DMT)-like permease